MAVIGVFFHLLNSAAELKKIIYSNETVTEKVVRTNFWIKSNQYFRVPFLVDLYFALAEWKEQPSEKAALQIVNNINEWINTIERKSYYEYVLEKEHSSELLIGSLYTLNNELRIAFDKALDLMKELEKHKLNYKLDIETLGIVIRLDRFIRLNKETSIPVIYQNIQLSS